MNKNNQTTTKQNIFNNMKKESFNMKKSTRIITCLLAILTLISTFSTLGLSVNAATTYTTVQEVKNVTIQNQKTGQYINFDNGVLKNGQPVRVWPFDKSPEQKFNIVKILGDTYRLVTASSSKYALDIYRGNSKLKAGQLADIWKNGADAPAQNVKFYRCSDGSFIICMAENTNLVLSAPDKKGRIKLDKFNTSDKSQRWVFKDKNGKNIDITTKATNSTSKAQNSIAKNWDSKVGKTVANIKSGKSYTKWYGSANMSYKAGYTGQCTWYAYGRFYETTGIALKYANNARRWLNDNKNDSRVKILKGANKIQANAIAVNTDGKYGHVMFIEYVTYNNGTPQYVYFTECNWDCNGKYNPNKDCILQKMEYQKFLSQRGPDGYIIAK